MENRLPFIHMFTYANKYYFYDVNTNKIVNVTGETYNLLNKLLSGCGIYEHPEIIKLQDKGFLSTNRPSVMIHPLNDVAEDFLGHKIRKITLQITQQCNFRCEYCVYSGGYSNRQHTSKIMDINTAKKAIDFIVEHSKEASFIDIGFYGGEPLLRFEFIKECIEYAEMKGEGKKIQYTLTSNGSIMNKEIIDFFHNHSVNLAISLDGPKEIHDNNRKFASNGYGTYDIVRKNINMIKEINPDYYRKVQISMTLDTSVDLGCLNQFIISEDMFDTMFLNANLIGDAYKKSAPGFTKDFFVMWEYNKFISFLSLGGRIEERKISSMFRRNIIKLAEYMSNTKKIYHSFSERDHHSGPCLPGHIRLFVNADGNFYPCERVSENSNAMKIGNLDSGFDFDKVRKLLNIGQLTSDFCQNCYAFRWCGLCAAYADNLDEGKNELSREKMLPICKNVRYNMEEDLKDYCALKDLGYDIDELLINVK